MALPEILIGLTFPLDDGRTRVENAWPEKLL
jgi:hypothetical protein